MEIHNMGTTTQYSGPTWNGNGFSEHEPNNLWGRLPESFKEIALAEILEGNKPISILENKERGIILLEFEKGCQHCWRLAPDIRQSPRRLPEQLCQLSLLPNQETKRPASAGLFTSTTTPAIRC